MAVDLSRPARLLVTCAQCHASYPEGTGHECPTWQVPPELRWIALDRLTTGQWIGTHCIRCDRHLGAAGVRPRKIGEVHDPRGRRFEFWDHGHNACPNPPPRGH